MEQLGYQPARNQYRIRTIIRDDGEPGRAIFKKAQRERANLLRRLRRSVPAVKAKARAYDHARRARPGELERDRARKRRWRAKNRRRYNSYYRRYDELKPGRREYKARKAREYRARDKGKTT